MCVPAAFRLRLCLRVAILGSVTFRLMCAQSVFALPQSSAAKVSPTSDDSIAAAARNAKNQKTGHAKKIITDDDMETSAGPLPRLLMDGAENADEVVAAIAKYKITHTPEQTEQAVRTWYDRYDQMLASAIQTNIDLKVIRQANMSNVEDLCQQSQDYEQCQNRRMAEYRGARDDQVEIAKNSSLEVRIQHAFGKIRMGLTRNGLHYDWFKVRTTNGIDIF